MKNLWTDGIIQRILIILVLIALLGISPLPHEVRTGFEEGRRALEFGSLAAYAEHLVSIAEQISWRADLWEQAGRYALAGNDPEAAIEYFKQAESQGKLSQNEFIAFGDAYLKIADETTAIQIWNRTNRQFGPSAETLIRVADVHRAQEDYEALIEDLKSLVSITPTAELNYELGFLLAAYQPDSAPPYLLQANEFNPILEDARELSFAIQRALPEGNSAYTLMASGQKLAELGKWELAMRAFSQAVQIQPAYAEAWAYLGEALQHNPDLSENSLEILGVALEIDPQSISANTLMAIYWQRQGNYEKAVEYLSQAAKIDPNNPAVQADLGAAYAAEGDFPTAQLHYQQAIELAPNDARYPQLLIEFLIRHNIDLRETALPLSRQLVDEYPNHAAARDVLGQVLFRLGDTLTAERYFMQALQLTPQYAPAHLHLGILYQFQGSRQLAESHLKQAIQLAPDTQTANHAERLLNE